MVAAPQTQGRSSEAGGVFALQVPRWALTCQQVSWKSTLYWWLEKVASGTPSLKSQLNHNTLLCDQDPGWAPAPPGPQGSARGEGRTDGRTCGLEARRPLKGDRGHRGWTGPGAPGEGASRGAGWQYARGDLHPEKFKETEKPWQAVTLSAWLYRGQGLRYPIRD